jgi:hypothetical protein
MLGWLRDNGFGVAGAMLGNSQEVVTWDTWLMVREWVWPGWRRVRKQSGTKNRVK